MFCNFIASDVSKYSFFYDFFQDLYRWWFLLKCSKAKMSVVSRSWLDVTSDKRYKKHKNSSPIQIQCDIACGSLVQTKFGSCNYLVLNKGFQNTVFAMCLIIFDSNKTYFMASSVKYLKIFLILYFMILSTRTEHNNSQMRIKEAKHQVIRM